MTDFLNDLADKLLAIDNDMFELCPTSHHTGDHKVIVTCDAIDECRRELVEIASLLRGLNTVRRVGDVVILKSDDPRFNPDENVIEVPMVVGKIYSNSQSADCYWILNGEARMNNFPIATLQRAEAKYGGSSE